MKHSIYLLLSATLLIVGCGTTSKLNKAQAYKGMYEEKPVSVLIMPPINRSTNVDAKEYFHTTLNVPILNAGYYEKTTKLNNKIPGHGSKPATG